MVAKFALIAALALGCGYAAGQVYRTSVAEAVDVEMKPAACYTVVAHASDEVNMTYALIFNTCAPSFAWLAVPPVPGGV